MHGSDEKPGERRPILTGSLMTGRRGLIMGVANDHSIAWGIARALAAHGAELAFTYQGEEFRATRQAAGGIGRIETAAALRRDRRGRRPAMPRSRRSKRNGAFSTSLSMRSRIPTRTNSRAAMSTRRGKTSSGRWIFPASRSPMWRGAPPMMMTRGGSMVTLTYGGSTRVMPNYNVMGVAKAALEASVRYLAVDLGRHGIRVNAISAGPMRTLAGSAVGDARYVFKWNKVHCSRSRNRSSSIMWAAPASTCCPTSPSA